MNNTDSIVIRTLVVRGRSFTIAYRDGFYMAIEDKYITDGKMNTSLNGFQMHADKKLSTCIELTTQAVECDYLMENGMSKAEAFCKVMNVPLTDELRDFFENRS